jgi:hypothetical protein
MKLTAKPAASTKVITNPHTQERIELLSEAKKHGQIFAATGGDHLTSNDMFKAIELKRRKILRERLAKEKTLRQRQERTEWNAWAILEKTANDPRLNDTPDVAPATKSGKYEEGCKAERVAKDRRA